MTLRGCLDARVEIVDRYAERVRYERQRVSAGRRVAILPVPDNRLIRTALLSELRLRESAIAAEARQLGVVEGPSAFPGHVS